MIPVRKILEDLGIYKEDIIRQRRYLHRNPELGLEEYKTADFICSELDGMNIEYERFGTAVCGIIRGAAESPCAALRADIDALPIQEESGEEFSSEIPGKMHACGHDGHTAILLGAARWLGEHRDLIPGTVKLFFQPAEETVGGANIMIEQGVLENPRVDEVYGLHLMPYMKPGHMEVKKGPLNGSSTHLDITVKGTSGHGAYPESGVDAIMVSAQVIGALQTVVSRRISPMDQAVVSLGVIRGGEARNIIAEMVKIQGTLRTANDQLRDEMIEKIRTLVVNTCAAHGAEGILEFSYGYGALVNSPDQVDLCAAAGEEFFGKEKVHWKEHPSLGVEDFSYFLNHRPGCFYHLGCGPKDGWSPLHSSTFRLDEESLILGAALQSAIAIRALERLSTN